MAKMLLVPVNWFSAVDRLTDVPLTPNASALMLAVLLWVTAPAACMRSVLVTDINAPIVMSPAIVASVMLLPDIELPLTTMGPAVTTDLSP